MDSRVRNDLIRKDYASGITLDEIRAKYGITVKQSHRIIWKKRYKDIQTMNKIKKILQCPACGSEFIKTNQQHCYCSEKCRDKREKTTRKARERKAKVVDSDITLTSLANRDKDRCHICGELCDWNDIDNTGGHNIHGNKYPSIDHVIPIAKGGKHSWANVKIAHRWCNSKKQAN